MKSVIFLVYNKEDGLATITQLTQDIKASEDANHKLYFRSLFRGIYTITRGETDENGNKSLVGEREVIFLPMDDTNTSKINLGKMSENKEVIFMDNCMFICGDSNKKDKRRKDLINWLLEKCEGFGGTVE